MKKILFSLVAVMVSLTAMAGSDIKIKEGAGTFVKEQGTAVVSFDFSNAKWEEKEDFKTWSAADYDKRVNTAITNFISGFNDKSKGLKLATDGTEAKYKIVFKIDNLERHQSFTGMWGQGKISVTGTITVIDASNNNICTLYIDGYGSGKDFDTTDGIGKCMKGLGEEIAKLKK